MAPVATYSLKMSTGAGGAGRQWGISFSGRKEYETLLLAWRHLAEKRGACVFTPRAIANDYPDTVRIDYDASANYIFGTRDHSHAFLALRVADDWLDDVIALWDTMRDRKGDEFWMDKRKSKTRGSTRHGYSLTVFYDCFDSLPEPDYELTLLQVP